MRNFYTLTKTLALSILMFTFSQNANAQCDVTIPPLSVIDNCAVLPTAPYDVNGDPVEFMWVWNKGPENTNSNLEYLTGFSVNTPLFWCPTGTEDGFYRVCARVDNGCTILEGPDIYVNGCGAEFEHVDVTNETDCNAQDGSITHDPQISSGTVLPYYVSYTFEGQLYTYGPYSNNQDYLIPGLAAGLYLDFTMTAFTKARRLA